METFSALLAICAGNSPVDPRWIPRTKASDAKLWCLFDLTLNKRFSKQSWGWWFETPSLSLWRHCNDYGCLQLHLRAFIKTSQSNPTSGQSYPNAGKLRPLNFLDQNMTKTQSVVRKLHWRFTKSYNPKNSNWISMVFSRKLAKVTPSEDMKFHFEDNAGVCLVEFAISQGYPFRRYLPGIIWFESSNSDHRQPQPCQWIHYNDVIMSMMASQITSLTIVYSTVYLGADQRKRQSSASLAFVQRIHR